MRTHSWDVLEQIVDFGERGGRLQITKWRCERCGSVCSRFDRLTAGTAAPSGPSSDDVSRHHVYSDCDRQLAAAVMRS